MAPNKVIREYHSDDSFVKRLLILTTDTEYQLCLAYATGSDEGKFTATWDTNKVTPDLIKEFKKICVAQNLPAKVFVSIGGNNPFKVAVDSSDVWNSNATSTLQPIIKDYDIDGIDVNYTKFDVFQYEFVNRIKNLIEDLREGKTGLVASLAPDAATNDGFYFPLYKATATDKFSFETVVFQCFVDLNKLEPLQKQNPVPSLVLAVEEMVEKYNPNDTKVLLGYSAIEEDWEIVSPPLFFLALNRLVQLPPRVKGASLKVISDEKASISATNWTPQFLSLAVADAEDVVN